MENLSTQPRSQATTSQTNRGIGNYIAEGLGLTSSSGSVRYAANQTTIPSGITGARSSTRILTSIDYVTLPLSGTGPNIPAQTGSAHSTAFEDRTTNTSGPTARIASATGPSESHAASNLTYTFHGDCWNQWSSFYELSYSVAHAMNSTIISYMTTVDETLAATSVFTTSLTQTMTTTDYDGSFAFETTASTFSIVITGSSTSPTRTVATIETAHSTLSTLVYPNITITPPPCPLASVVPQCQAQWELWATAQLGIGQPAPDTACNPFTGTTTAATCLSDYNSVASALGSYQIAADVRESHTQNA